MRKRQPVPPHSGSARPQITIRAFGSGDEPGLRQIFIRAIEGLTTADYDRRQRAAWAGTAMDIAAWNARIQRLRPFIAMRGDVMAGYADLQADGLIDHFFVDAGHARRGVGGALMRHIEQQAAQRGLSALHAHVSRSAEGFFATHGFTVDRRQTVHLDGVALDNALMHKRVQHLPRPIKQQRP